MSIKKEFVEYLRSYYGAEVLTADSGLPPLDVGPNYPAFRDSRSMNDMLGHLGGMQGPPQAGMGLGGPMMGGGAPMGLPAPQRVGGDRDVRDAENLLL